MISGIALTIALASLLMATKTTMEAMAFWIKITNGGRMKIDAAPRQLKNVYGRMAASIIIYYIVALGAAFMAGHYA